MSTSQFKEYYKLPRIFTDFPLKEQGSVSLNADHTHYLKNVLRRKIGDEIRVFNEKNGEFLSEIKEFSKKEAICTLKTALRQAEHQKTPIHLLFSPLSKQRMVIIIEKSVELGVTDLHPIITERTEVRKLNEERIKAQIIEAAEQCERMRIPTLHRITPLLEKIAKWNGPKIFWAAERLSNIQSLKQTEADDWAFLIGPVGGFTEEESNHLKNLQKIIPISLGSNILRAETACLFCLAHAQIKGL